MKTRIYLVCLAVLTVSLLAMAVVANADEAVMTETPGTRIEYNGVPTSWGGPGDKYIMYNKKSYEYNHMPSVWAYDYETDQKTLVADNAAFAYWSPVSKRHIVMWVKFGNLYNLVIKKNLDSTSGYNYRINAYSDNYASAPYWGMDNCIYFTQSFKGVNCLMKFKVADHTLTRLTPFGEWGDYCDPSFENGKLVASMHDGTIAIIYFNPDGSTRIETELCPWQVYPYSLPLHHPKMYTPTVLVVSDNVSIYFNYGPDLQRWFRGRNPILCKALGKVAYCYFDNLYVANIPDLPADWPTAN